VDPRFRLLHLLRNNRVDPVSPNDVRKEPPKTDVFAIATLNVEQAAIADGATPIGSDGKPLELCGAGIGNSLRQRLRQCRLLGRRESAHLYWRTGSRRGVRVAALPAAGAAFPAGLGKPSPPADELPSGAGRPLMRRSSISWTARSPTPPPRQTRPGHLSRYLSRSSPPPSSKLTPTGR
jgi:hypothetical protein